MFRPKTAVEKSHRMEIAGMYLPKKAGRNRPVTDEIPFAVAVASILLGA